MSRSSWSVSPKNKIKTLALMADEADARPARASARAVVVLAARRPQLNEAKLSRRVGGKETRPMQEEEIQAALQVSGGIPGPDWHRMGQGS